MIVPLLKAGADNATQITGNFAGWVLIEEATTGVWLDLLFACTSKHETNNYLQVHLATHGSTT